MHKGAYRPSSDCESHNIAVKTCKADTDLSMADKFLEEAYIMQQFDHQHIIKLVGICSSSPIWIVMELARHGELRAYLQNNKHKLDLATLVLYSYQLSTALSYIFTRSLFSACVSPWGLRSRFLSCPRNESHLGSERCAADH